MKELGALGREWMPRCIELGARAAGKVSPNPMVGAVVLDRRGRLVGEGTHRGPGAAHAEVAALRAAGSRARGGTVIVNLEPCNHHGRTPPCTDALRAAGIARVVYGAPDPIVGHRGGARALRRAGLEVVSVQARECREQNRIFFTFAELGRPFVVVKVAASLDGKSATGGGESKWITGEKARADGRVLRSHLDAICVGVETVLADDPALTARRRGGRDPLRLVFDSRLRTPTAARLLPCNADSPAGCIIATSEAAPSSRVRALEAAGAEILVAGRKRPDPLRVLAALAERSLTSVLVEGGPALIASFSRADLIDELRLYQAAVLLGGGAISWIAGQSVADLAAAPRFDTKRVRQLGPDVVIEALRRR